MSYNNSRDDDAEFKYESVLGETEHAKGAARDVDKIFDGMENVEKNVEEELHIEDEAEQLIGVRLSQPSCTSVPHRPCHRISTCTKSQLSVHQ